ncbi:MAG: glycosyltransferase [Candidatus Eisenbacteria bacterium]|nr:glycosyltransferase [Candidatus Eisenbacteria bacterium]
MAVQGRGLHLVFFSDCPYFGGAEEYVAMLAAARPNPDWRLSAIVSAGEAGATLAQKLARADVEVHRLAWGSWHSPGLWRRIHALLRRLGGEVLHINLPSIYDGRMSVPAPLAKAAGYRRVVTTEHLPMIERARRLMGVKIACTTAIDAIIVHTEWNRQFLGHRHHLPLRKIHVIPNGSPPAPPITEDERSALRRSLGVGEDAVAVAMVGRLTARKGHRILLEALAVLPRKGRGAPWRLLVVGEGEERAALERQATELGIGERVGFLGQRADAPRLIAVSDLLVLPSLLESQPLVITEAMAAGVPVVASRIYGIPEIVVDGETGMLVPPGESPPLAEALSALLADPARRARMGTAAQRRYAAELTQEIMARRTYGLLAGELAEGEERG